MANNSTLEERVQTIERELAVVKSHLAKKSEKPWWQEISGVFENDPNFEKIVALGQEIRKHERPNTKS